jgi:GcrA cell cycle regulator
MLDPGQGLHRMLWLFLREGHEMEWSDEIIERLRALWAEGLSTAEIGRRMGISKNAVVGKAHRLNLPARPSPIRRGGEGGRSRPVVRRVVGPTLPPLATATLPPVTQAPAPAPRPAIAVTKPAPALRPAASPASRAARFNPCCWPLGEPGTAAFRFCDEASLTGKPYCAEHAQLAYVKVRDKRDEAAA